VKVICQPGGIAGQKEETEAVIKDEREGVVVVREIPCMTTSRSKAAR
jgi:hypothetical protein